MPSKIEEEEAAFILAEPVYEENKLVLKYKTHIIPDKKDFDIKSAWHIELTDEFQQQLIQAAHKSNASIIELHSHIDQEEARFSKSDMFGFETFVPQVFWRLKKKTICSGCRHRRQLRWIGLDYGPKSSSSTDIY